MIRLGILMRATLPVAALALLTTVCWSGTHDLRHPAPGGAVPFVDLVAAVCAWALLLGLGWLLLITLVVVAEVLSRGDSGGGPSPRAPRAWSRGLGCPPGLRRAVLIGCGLSVLLTAAPATAADSDAAAPLDLTGLVLPDRALSTPATTSAPAPGAASPHEPDAPVASSTPTPRDSAEIGETAPPADPTPHAPQATRSVGDGGRADSASTSRAASSSPTDRATRKGQPRPSSEGHGRARVGTPTVTVRAGDTLWALARDHLPASAGPAAVAAEVERWHATNDAVVADPDLIHPGQRLTAPDATATGPTHDTEENR